MDGQSGVEIRNSILDAMENLISSNKKSSSFDKMFLGRIKSVKGVNLYDVVINGKLYTNVQGIKSFEVNINDIVFCIAPQNNINMLRVLFSLSKDLKNIEEIKKEISNNAKAIISKQDKLTFDITPTANSTNPVTSDGINTALTKNNSKQYMIKIGQNVLVNAPLNINYVLPWAYNEHGDPRGIVFSGKTGYDDFVSQYYPLTFLTDAMTNKQFSLQFRDCYLTYKNFKCTYDRNAVVLTADVKQQAGWKDANVLDIYLVW